MSFPTSGPPNPRHARYRRIHVSHWSAYPATIVLIAISCLVAIVSELGNNEKPIQWMFFSYPETITIGDELQQMEEAGETDTDAYSELQQQYHIAAAANPSAMEEIKHGQVWRILTPMFMHFSILHIGFNMLWLWTLGRMLEPMLGRPRFLIYIAIISAASNIAEGCIGGPSFGGMSGVIYGLFGFVVVYGKLHPGDAPHLDPRTVRFMLIWLVLCFTNVFGHIANWAHSFGLVSGAVLGIMHAARNGGIERFRRRHQFRRAITEAHANALHECAVCRKTEHHDPDLEFRVGKNGNEYCIHHLPENDSP